MALVEPHKKGGRYTIQEKEERRIQVYHLHFEENKSAVKISELLGVSRNTINDDISYWHSQLAHEFNAQDITAKMTKQIQGREMQRDRLLKNLEGVDLDEKLKIEKDISEIDDKLMQYYSKMILSGNTTLDPTVKIDGIDEDEIKELVRDLIFQEGLEELHSENDLKFHFIRETKCNVKHAENLLERMLSDGLVLCRQIETERGYFKSISGDYSFTYNLERFANLRGYVTENELYEILNRRSNIKIDNYKMDKIEIKLNEKYGDKTQWPDELLEKFESEE
ncbi:MAG: hypothetical protein COA77_10585 [Thaumarchaeota archaeon]|nr:MAG: hypothetical protein COA77_10585 [Nitrososphaerota archaeon]